MELKIRELLYDPEKYEWDHDVFIRSTSSYDLESEVLVLDMEEYDVPECPESLKKRGLCPFLSVAQIQDIVSNLESQCKGSDLVLRLKALRCYQINDAFYVV